MKTWLTKLCAAGALIAAMGTAQADVVKVGLIADFTGAFATWGTQFQQAVDAYQVANGTGKMW